MLLFTVKAFGFNICIGHCFAVCIYTCIYIYIYIYMGTTGLRPTLRKNLLFTAPKMYNCRKNIYVVLNINGATDFV